MSASDAARWERALDLLAAALDERGARGWIVGGCLRDALLGRPVRDIDLASTCNPLDFARSLPRATLVTLAPLNRDSARAGLCSAPGDTPLQVDLSPLHATIEGDLARRDFRVNAMALPLAARGEFIALLAGVVNRAPDGILPAPDHLIDPLHGYADLQHRVLNLASSHAFSDDPGRILRAARLVASHNFALAPDLIRLARGAAQQLITVPGDRLRDEMSLLLALPRAAEGVAALAEMETLSILLPGLNAPAKIAHAIAALRAAACLQEDGEPGAPMEPLASLDALHAWYAAPLRPVVPRIAALRWALLAHAVLPHGGELGAASDESATSARQPLATVLRVPLAGIERTVVMAARTCDTWRVRLAGAMPSDAELRHLFAAHSSMAADILVAAAACNAALVVNPLPGARSSPFVAERVRAILDIYFTDREHLLPPPLLTGADLIAALGMRPGATLGALLRHIRTTQLDGAISSRAEALALARKLASTKGASQP